MDYFKCKCENNCNILLIIIKNYYNFKSTDDVKDLLIDLPVLPSSEIFYIESENDNEYLIKQSILIKLKKFVSL